MRLTKIKSLMGDNTLFSRVMEEYGHSEKEVTDGVEKSQKDSAGIIDAEKSDGKAKITLMQEEERYVGSVAWATYGAYLRYAGGIFWAPVLLVLLVLMQGSQGKRFMLSYWILLTRLSGQHSFPRFLDFREHWRIFTGRLHGALRRSWCGPSLLFLLPQFLYRARLLFFRNHNLF